MSEPLVDALLNPAAYPHPVDRVELLQTHISWVFLAGDYAYKVKKPVQFGFLDFSTLERRRFFCEEELRLNGRLAPQLYLQCVPLGSGGAGKPDVVIGGEPAVEWAVKMRRFPQEALLVRLAEESRLTPEIIDALAAEVAEFHGKIARAGTDTPVGQLEAVLKPVLDCYEPAAAGGDARDRQRLDEIRAWVDAEHQKKAPVFESRRQAGFIRECHGDMHLGNMLCVADAVCVGGASVDPTLAASATARPPFRRNEATVVIFDGIEFNESLRWIDVMSEVAFTFMDLVDHGQPRLAQRFLNGYLEHTGDYAGLSVLRFYAVYRALVRAKVAGLRLAQPDLAPDERTEQNAFRRGYVVLAKLLTKPDPVRLLITHGLSGSGKSTGTQRLLEELPAIRIRSDIERKRLGFAPDALYTPQATTATYDRLLDLARQIVADGYAVIVDATFLKRAERQRFQDLAVKLGVPYTILHFDAPHEELRKRVAARQARGVDPSDATVDVLELQIRTAEPFDESERAFVENALLRESGTG